MNPQRKYRPQDDVEPEIRPNLRLVQGGGQTSPRQNDHVQEVPRVEDNEEESDASSGLRGLEGGGESTPRERGHLSAVGGDDLSSQEDEAANRAAQSNDRVGLGFNEEPEGKSLRERLRNNPRLKKKFMLAGAIGGSVGSLGILVLLLFLMLTFLKIPGLAQNLASYEGARASRQFAESAQSVTEETLAAEAANSKTYTGWRAIYQNAKGSVQDAWGLMDRFRPGKLASNLQTTGQLKPVYSDADAFGRQRLIGAIFDGKQYNIEQVTGASRFVPGLNSLLKLNNQAQFISDIQPAINAGLKDQDVGLLIRSLVGRELQKSYGLSTAGVALAQFKDKSGTAAQVEETQQRATDVDLNTKGEGNTAPTESIKDATQAAEDAEKQALGSDTQIQAAMNNGGVVKGVVAAVNTSLTKGGVTGAIQQGATFLGPFGAAISVCTVYAGSVERSGPTIDHQMAQEQETYYYEASLAGQQEYGSRSSDPNATPELIAAIGASNLNLGDTNQSNIYQQASGAAIDTSKTLSAESGGASEFTLLNATLGQAGVPGANGVADAINSFGDLVCPVVTNEGVVIGGAVVSIAAGILSLGVSSSAEAAAAQGSEAAVNTAAKSVAENLVTKYVGKTAGRITNLLYDTGKGTVKSAVKLGGLTAVAHLVVMSQAGQMFSGFAQDTDLANNAQAGAKIHYNELERTELFGRPLMMDELCASNQLDVHYIGEVNSEGSAYSRYFSPSNPQSLASRTAVDLDVKMNGSVGNTLTSLGTMLLQPYRSLEVVQSIFTGKSGATPNCDDDTTQYGIVPFGWSAQEENLYEGSSYRMLENQKILDESGKEDAIAKTYAICFGYQYNPNGDGNLDPTDPSGNMVFADGPGGASSLGTVLSDPDGKYLVRDQHGNVEDTGLCSKDNLSYNSTNQSLGFDQCYGNPDGCDGFSSPQMNDLVFRWRLAMNYDTTISQLTSLQTAGANP